MTGQEKPLIVGGGSMSRATGEVVANLAIADISIEGAAAFLAIKR
jgi:hypothetical protein